ncbi:hypothetical protein B0H14DRAFT_3450477 [Mycena olivaceomarginata]|nr:hypothetical protein B0H14DRAFT_3450477 [Mycena olivaceomarginata]
MSLVPSMTFHREVGSMPLPNTTGHGGPSTGTSMPHGTQRPFTSNTRAVSQPNKPPTEISFAIWPFSPFSHQHADPEYPDLYPTDPRLIGSEGSAWATVFNDFNLLFKFELCLDIVFYRHQAKVWLPAQDFGGRCLLYEFTVTGLAKQKSFPDPVNPAGVIYFIGPKHGPLQGPLPAGRIPHACFPLRVQYALESDKEATQIRGRTLKCSDACTSWSSCAAGQSPHTKSSIYMPPLEYSN